MYFSRLLRFFSDHLSIASSNSSAPEKEESSSNSSAPKKEESSSSNSSSAPKIMVSTSTSSIALLGVMLMASSTFIYYFYSKASSSSSSAPKQQESSSNSSEPKEEESSSNSNEPKQEETSSNSSEPEDEESSSSSSEPNIMASTSTSSIQNSFKYDVFLSFRGEDTRKNFVGHLYQALKQKGIETYKDDETIEQGERINDQLLKSIEDSKFYIIVFSKNYASSSWCLDELVKIMQCQKMTGHTAYPVFYDVEPTEVRNQSGAVKEAFAEHEKKEAAGKWRDAMKELAYLAGWELKATANGDESKSIQIIVDVIFKKLHSTNSSADGKLVGMETRISNVISSLEIGTEDVRAIGIRGIGGGGKTTLARAVYDRISTMFEETSFVENVREVSKPSLSGLKELQKRILKAVLNKQYITFSSVHDGKNMLKATMRCRKVLVVLDDVDRIDQLEALADEPDWFKSGSRIIITTRDEQVLRAHGVKFVHDVDLLSSREAICLFSRYAFRKDIPIQGYEELSGQVVQYAAGLPLTIRILGSFLCGKGKLEWIDAIERLKKIPLKDTLEKLELSYISLEGDYKEIFLDISCILKGHTKEEAIRILESCGFCARNGLKVLEQRSLITIYKDEGKEYLGMHDHIEEMGKNIVRREHPDEPNKHSRLWIDKEIEDILANDMGNEATKCLKHNASRGNERIFMKGLGKMKKLRYLEVNFADYSTSQLDESTQYFTNSLKYLKCSYYPFLYLPKTFQANNLVGLEMFNSRILQLWEDGEEKVLKNLKFLNLSRSMLRSLDLELIPNLERLDLENCVKLVKVNAPVGCLEKVGYLNLSGCLRFTNFKFDGRCEPKDNFSSATLSLYDFKRFSDMICSLRCLKMLTLACDIPEFISFGQLECLEELCLSSTQSKHLPDSIWMLKHLKSLVIYNNLLEKLPEDLGQLECLENLHVRSKKIQFFPDSICLLKRLRRLDVTNCSCLGKLLEDIGQLECLEELHLSSTELKHLPDSICMFKHLKSLTVNGDVLEKLPEDLGQLECLERLYVNSKKIEYLPDSICMLKHMTWLEVAYCWSLGKLPEDIGQLESLETLVLSATAIKHLPDSICMLKHLKYLNLEDCLLLEKLPENLGRLECLEHLDITCTRIRRLPQSIFGLKDLLIAAPRNLLQLYDFPSEIQTTPSPIRFLPRGKIARVKR